MLTPVSRENLPAAPDACLPTAPQPTVEVSPIEVISAPLLVVRYASAFFGISLKRFASVRYEHVEPALKFHCVRAAEAHVSADEIVEHCLRRRQGASAGLLLSD